MFEIERIAKAVGGDGKGFEIERIADALESGSGTSTGGGVEYVTLTSDSTTLNGDFDFKYITDAIAANKQLIFICNTVFLYIGQVTTSPDKVIIYAVDIDGFDIYEGAEDSTTHKMVFTPKTQL